MVVPFFPFITTGSQHVHLTHHHQTILSSCPENISASTNISNELVWCVAKFEKDYKRERVKTPLFISLLIVFTHSYTTDAKNFYIIFFFRNSNSALTPRQRSPTEKVTSVVAQDWWERLGTFFLSLVWVLQTHGFINYCLILRPIYLPDKAIKKTNTQRLRILRHLTYQSPDEGISHSVKD